MSRSNAKDWKSFSPKDWKSKRKEKLDSDIGKNGLWKNNSSILCKLSFKYFKVSFGPNSGSEQHVMERNSKVVKLFLNSLKKKTKKQQQQLNIWTVQGAHWNTVRSAQQSAS